MKKGTIIILDDLCSRYPQLSECKESIIRATEILIKSYSREGKLLCCGNGGSASDSLHIVGELMKQFVISRSLPEEFEENLKSGCDNADYLCEHLQGALPAIALVGSAAIESAFANDCAPDLTFAQQVLGLGCPQDVLLGITTSGNSKNVILAVEVAKAKGMKTIALTGIGGGKIASKADVSICVPEKETYKVQELHLPVYHALCMAVEYEFFGK